MKKICVVTASRSEYGLLRWLIDEINIDKDLSLQLIVTGSHLSEEFGFTYKEIESDGYKIDCKLDMLLSSSSKSSIVKSMGYCSLGLADILDSLNPDLIVVLGDRYELLPICSAALVMCIPIAHISGGDITEGAIDDSIRNAITMMSTLHFPGVESSALNIARMIGVSKDIYAVGEPGLDNFRKLSLWSREQIAISLGLDINKKWLLVTQHPETRLSIEDNLQIVVNIVSALNYFQDFQVIITKANADFGGCQINNYFETIVKQSSDRFKIFSSLGQIRYLSILNEAVCVIGNSSSGIVEAPYVGLPVINIANRQKGRYCSPNVINVSGYDDSIYLALKNIISKDCKFPVDYYYGDGFTSFNIKSIIKNYLYDKK